MEGVATLKGETLYETKPSPVRNGEFILGGHSCRVVVTEDAPPVNTTSGSCNGGPRSASAIASLVLPGSTKFLIDDVVQKHRQDLLIPIAAAVPGLS